MYILNNVDQVQPYFSAHKSLTMEKSHWMSEKMLLTKHNKNYITWFNETVSKESSASEKIKWMSHMPKFNVIFWSAYYITKFSIYKKLKDDRSTTQDSGFVVEVESMYFSSSKDNNHVLASRT